MANKDDVGFTFDPKPFLNALKQIGGGMDKTKKAVQKSTADIGKSFMWAMTKAQLMATGIIAIGKSIKNVVNEQIPEIGQAFGIAKEIIFKNLFWPLRQQIVPMLQKMLDWVRDNRTMFVKMGEVIVSIFRTGWTIAKTFVGALSPVFDALKKLVGFNKGDWMDGVNLVMAKVATVAIYLGMALKPVIDFLSGIVSKIADSGIIKTFVDLAMAVGKVAWEGLTGFLAGISGSGAIESILSNIKGLGEAFTSLFSAWSDKKNGATMYTVFEKIGSAVGEIGKFFVTLGTAFGGGLAANLSTIMTPLQTIFDAVSRLFGGLNKGPSTFLGDVFKQLGLGLGALVTTGLNAVAVALDAIVSSVLTLAGLGTVIQDIFKGDWGAIGGHLGDAFKNMSGLADRTKTAFSQTTTAWGNVMNSNSVDTTNPNPKKYATGTPYVPKDGLAYLHRGEKVTTAAENRQPNQGQGNWNVTLNVTEGNAKAAGQNFATGMQYQIRGLLAGEAAAGGR